MKNKPIMQLEEVWAAHEKALPGSGQQVLEVFAITGLADVNQVIAATGLTRDRATRALLRFSSSISPLLREHAASLARPGQRGKPARIYLLTEMGASILEMLGYADARACGLRDDLPILHAQAMLDVHLAALREGVSIETDRTLEYGDASILRPDHQVTLDDGMTLFIEVEQAASTETLRRVVESLEHKQQFFNSLDSKSVVPEVRMLLNLPRDATWTRTLNTWQRAFELVSERHNGQMGFRLFVLPLREFLNSPDFGNERQSEWQEIVAGEKKSLVVSQPGQVVPKALLYQSSRQERLVLTALWQDFLENASGQCGEYSRPDPEFLRLVRLIHAASHDPALPAIERASVPHASLYLLNRYLGMRNLRTRLQKTMHNGRGSLRWNPTTIMHRVQVVADAFLGAHGWRSSGPLMAYATTSEWSDAENRTFTVHVRIREPEIMLLDGETVLPTRDEIAATEQALSWVLWALFSYSLELGMGRVEFW